MNSEDRVRHASKRRMRSRLGVGRAHPTGKKFGGSMKKLATWFLHVIVPSAPAVHLSLFLVPPILAMGSRWPEVLLLLSRLPRRQRQHLKAHGRNSTAWPVRPGAFNIALRAMLASKGSVDCVTKGSATSWVVERSGGFTISLTGHPCRLALLAIA